MIHRFRTNAGFVELSESEKGVGRLRFVGGGKPTARLSRNAAKVRDFLNCRRVDLSGIRLDLASATKFQRRVWGLCRKIPRGKTVTYGLLARKLKTSPRALGQALNQNPIPVIIPCHRVVAAGGLGGFALGIHLKTRLLKLENTLKSKK